MERVVRDHRCDLHSLRTILQVFVSVGRHGELRYSKMNSSGLPLQRHPSLQKGLSSEVELRIFGNESEILMSSPSVSDLLKSRVKVTDDAVAGASAGGIARMISAPFDVIKIRFQLQSQQNPKYTSIFQAFRTVVQEEGVLSLWKGNLSASYLWISYMMVQFSIYGVLKRTGEKMPYPFQSEHTRGTSTNPNETLTNGHKAWKAFVSFMAGAGAGM